MTIESDDPELPKAVDKLTCVWSIGLGSRDDNAQRITTQTRIALSMGTRITVTLDYSMDELSAHGRRDRQWVPTQRGLFADVTFTHPDKG